MTVQTDIRVVTEWESIDRTGTVRWKKLKYSLYMLTNDLKKFHPQPVLKRVSEKQMLYAIRRLIIGDWSGPDIRTWWSKQK